HRDQEDAQPRPLADHRPRLAGGRADCARLRSAVRPGQAELASRPAPGDNQVPLRALGQHASCAPALRDHDPAPTRLRVRATHLADPASLRHQHPRREKQQPPLTLRYEAVLPATAIWYSVPAVERLDAVLRPSLPSTRRRRKEEVHAMTAIFAPFFGVAPPR